MHKRIVFHEIITINVIMSDDVNVLYPESSKLQFCPRYMFYLRSKEMYDLSV